MTLNLEAANKPALATLAVTAWFGVLLQLWLSLAKNETMIGGLVEFLGFFTVLTNLFVALTATLPLVAGANTLGRFFAKPMVLGCATTSIFSWELRTIFS